MTRITAQGWKPRQSNLTHIDFLLQSYREHVGDTLAPLAQRYCPSLISGGGNELKKMLELSTKMTMVGHACSEIAGFPFNNHRRTIAAYYGGCCFLADSFIDDYGESVSREFVERFELLLTKGWFEIRSDREELFYVIISRLFIGCDMLNPMVRQAVLSLFQAQRNDIMLRLDAASFRQLPRPTQLRILRTCARDRSGHGILVLAHLMAPAMPLDLHHLLYLAGSLIMYIDDHGDYHADRQCKRLTYMNQVKQPQRALSKIFTDTMSRLRTDLPGNAGKDLLCTFLFRYFITRIEKHDREREKGGLSWSVYE